MKRLIKVLMGYLCISCVANMFRSADTAGNMFNKMEYFEGYSLKTPRFLIRNNTFSTWNRTKRGVIHLYNIITCATGCDPVKYKGYGCFCGFLGAGTPIDGIDRCCKQHDTCYEIANCPMYLEYFVPYYWKCWSNVPFCALDHGEFGAPGSCADMLCECDRALAVCLKQYSCPDKRAFCKSSPFRLIQNLFMLFT
ncbi:hypothetical protein ABEB36_012346 [Hypothenemus hampei]|uniref:Phospholipase A2 n=1 Tax=Hypothenemus hampei TaxID=57062 RepID=A0ABD1EB71_HYPHA